MKKLLRSSILALLVFAGYAAVSASTSLNHASIGVPPTQIPCGGRAMCAK
jgi:hypothetical protein